MENIGSYILFKQQFA